jgi:hypothetical protein
VIGKLQPQPQTQKLERVWGEGERHKNKETERHRNEETERHRNEETERHKNKDTERHRNKETELTIKLRANCRVTQLVNNVKKKTNFLPTKFPLTLEIMISKQVVANC